MQILVPAFSRRQFLRALGQGALLTALPGYLLAEAADTVTISILHTTDLHGHILPTIDYQGNANLGGLARCATQIRRWQRANSDSILLDIGDVYQGTEVGLRAQGATMIRCLNALTYDAWVIGNHDFDWGLDSLSGCIQNSAMPVLFGNALYAGQPIGKLPDAAGPFTRLRPYLIKEVAGFRIAIVSLTTPALSTWLPPEYLGGFEALDPVEALRATLREVTALQPDAIILAGHMGLTRRDDNPNRIGALTREFPQLTACIGGHTHQNHGSEIVNRVLYTQADHYGLYAGKVDLTFDRASRRLVQRTAVTVPMDAALELDPVILSLARDDLDAAHLILERPIGELTDTFDADAGTHPSDVQRLFGSAIKAALQKKGCEIDAVVHGVFEHAPLAAGIKTVRDAWTLLPYENGIVTVELSREDLLALARDLAAAREAQNLMGIRVLGMWDAGHFHPQDLRAGDGSPLPVQATYRLALNSYDSQSGGGRFPVIGRLVERASSQRILHPLDTREALIDFFVTRQKIGRSAFLV